MPAGIYPRNPPSCECGICPLCRSRVRNRKSFALHRKKRAWDFNQLTIPLTDKVSTEPLPSSLEEALRNFFNYGLTAREVAVQFKLDYNVVKTIYKRLEAEEDEKFNGQSKDTRRGEVDARGTGSGSNGHQLRHDSRESGQGDAGALHPKGD